MPFMCSAQVRWPIDAFEVARLARDCDCNWIKAINGDYTQSHTHHTFTHIQICMHIHMYVYVCLGAATFMYMYVRM